MTTTTSVLSDLFHEVRGSGPPVLFIPGASGDAGHFARTAARLADEFTTVTYDRRGCSRSAKLAGDAMMSIAAQADDAAELITELGLAPAVVFGTSGGGNIGLELIARRPEVLRGAVIHEPALVAVTAGPDEVDDDEIASLMELAARSPRAGMEAFVRRFTSDESFEALDPQHRERVLGNGAHFFGRELEAFATYVPDLDRVRAAGVAVHVLAGRDGQADDRDAAAWLAERLGRPVELISGHHAPYLQDPEAFAEELRPLVRALAAASGR